MLGFQVEHYKFFLKKIYLFHVCGYTVAVFRHTRRGHQMPITDGCEPPYGCWELNSGPLEKAASALSHLSTPAHVFNPCI